MAVAWLLWPFVLSLTAFFAIFPCVNSIITESESLLKFKQSLKDAKSLDSWGKNPDPCEKNKHWIGLICKKRSVFGLQIEQMGLSGNIDVAPLTDLPGLRTISIMNNSFTGNIPEFNRLPALRSIYISGNRFSGKIPSDYFAKMVSLKKVWMSNNDFSGLIPNSLATTLPHLMELRLENNQFSGIIPNFTQQSLVNIDLSNNRLTGGIPFGLSKFEQRSFAGNSGLCGPKMGTNCTQMTNDTSAPIAIDGTMKDANKSKYFIAFGTLGGLLIVIIISLAFRKKKKKKHRRIIRNDHQETTSEQDSNDNQQIQVTVDGVRGGSKKGPAGRNSRSGELSNRSGGVGGPELVMVNNAKGVFGLPDLMKASAYVLGNTGSGSRPSSSSGVGSAYKAVIASGVALVVKRVTVMNQVTIDVFDKDIRRLGSLRHKNILTPLAYHFRRDEKLLVFEFIPNLSLLHRLHSDHSEEFQLDWPSRLKIIQGIARGMSYLHSELGFLTLPHGNLKSSNIFLTDDGEPLISEFGLQRLINPDSQSQSLLAHKSPESLHNGTVSTKSDVFCFGVVALEILTGKFPSQYAGLDRAGGTDIVEWIGSAAEQGDWMELLHPTIGAAANDNNKKSSNEIEKVLQISVKCTGDDPDRRPTMIEVVEELTKYKSDYDDDDDDDDEDFISIQT